MLMNRRRTSSEKTQQWLDWKPREIGILEDIQVYFED